MRKLYYFLFISSFSFGQGIWTEPTIVDDSLGSNPNFHVVHNNDLLISYNYDNGEDNELVFKRMVNGETSFNDQIKIANLGVEADIIPFGEDTLFCAYQNWSSCKIMMSTDNGATWASQKTYSNTEMADGKGRVKLIRSGNDLRVFYHFMKVSGIFGTQDFMKRAYRINGVWETAEEFDFERFVGAYEQNGEIIVISSKGVYTSSDGINFDFNPGGTDNEEKLAASDCAFNGNDIEILRQYTYGMEPSNHIRLVESNDLATTWNNPQTNLFDADYSLSYLHYGSDANIKIALWTGINENWQTDKLIYTMSEDGGNSWSNIDTLVQLNDGESFTGEEFIDIEVLNNKIHLSYSILGANGEKHVFYKRWEPVITSNMKSSIETVLAYPNPFNESITLDGLTTNSTIQIYNALGKSVSFTQANNQLNLQLLSSGFYFIHVNNEDNSYILKVFKK